MKEEPGQPGRVQEVDLLKCLAQVIGRAALPEDKLRKILGTGEDQIRAYNLCDGSLSQRQIAGKCRLDEGNFSRTLARWIASGIVFRLGKARAETFLHIYPLWGGATKTDTNKTLKKRKK